ncbi:GTPase IMAP family member 8 isoform X1 [Canis lupus baileyi]|uniref:GTPase IMAP family member 8 isoform X1 n=1 Tax=Canis lupus baileyi TaxID=143281 RepID=UPI003B96D4F0
MEPATRPGTEPSRTDESLGQEREPEPGCSRPELRLLLLGRSGVGKSATGNTILGRSMFVSKFSNQMVTKVCQRESRATGEGTLVVIDTPYLFSSMSPAEDKQRNIERCLELCAPSLHVLLLVIAIGCYELEDKEVVCGVQEVFGAEARRYMIVVFTRKDDLEGDSVQDYIEGLDSLRELVENCGGRYCALNNKGSEEERVGQVRELLGMVQRLVGENGGPYIMKFRNQGGGFLDSVKGAASQKEDKLHGGGELQRQATGYEPNPGIHELKVLLVGKRGAGKSAAGNSLLGKRVFETKFSEESVTRRFVLESRIWRERRVVIIDTPDISSSKDIKAELRRHVFGGPHAFLLVTPLGSFSKKDEVVLDTLQASFGDKFVEYLIILFTRKEDLGDQDLEMFLKSRSTALCKLIKKCKDRYCVFSYRVTREEEQHQAEELLQTVVSLVQQHGDRPCTFREQEPLSLVLVGKSGPGKSATGNTILGRPDFLSQFRAQPVTRTCQSSRRLWGQQEVVVVDMPSLCLMASAEGGPSQLEEEVRRCWSCCKGNKILVLVFQLGWFTQEDKRAVKELETIFGEEVLKYTIVLFTRKEDLEVDIADYIKNAENRTLQNIIKRCGGRICAFNNKETGQAREDQAAVLLTMANQLIESHGGHGYPQKWENISKSIKNGQDKHKPKHLLKNLKEILL